MGFNVETVQELMSLVDDHKDEIKEATYIQVCNAIQLLHRQANRTAPPTPPQRAPTVWMNHARPTEPIVGRTDSRYDPWENDATVQMERNRMQAIRSRIRGIQDLIATTNPGNVKLEDKYKVLSTMFEYTGAQRNTDVTAYFKELQRNRVLTGVRFKQLCLDEKMARHARTLAEYRVALTNVQSEEAEARHRLIRAVHNRTPWV
jgi:hypothetical protein